VDRLDYLRRDSLCTGADYGHFDWYRLLNTVEIYEDDESGRDIVWPEKSLLAIEEYIFARYYMYQNVYLHKTTRGFEKLVEAMWKRARQLWDDGRDVALVPAIAAFWEAGAEAQVDLGNMGPTVSQYLAIEEFTVLSQVQNWTSHQDKALGDLARRFLERRGLVMVEAPDFCGAVAPNYEEWEAALRAMVGKSVEYDPPEMYCLADRLRANDYQPYFPEKESHEQSVHNAIRVRVEGEAKPIEVFKLLRRLEPQVEKPADRVRYYIPKELKTEAKKLRDEWK
jgi:HD superfamily phosphohydrolase